jgi:hypothetical protein
MEIKFDFKDYSNCLRYYNDYLSITIWIKNKAFAFRQCHINDILLLKIHDTFFLEYQFANMSESQIIPFKLQSCHLLEKFINYILDDVNYGN